MQLEQKLSEEVAADTKCRGRQHATCRVGNQKSAPRHTIHPGEERSQDTQQRHEAAEEYHLAAVLAKEVLPQLNSGSRHADMCAVSHEQSMSVPAPNPVPSVVPHDRARGCGRDHQKLVSVAA